MDVDDNNAYDKLMIHTRLNYGGSNKSNAQIKISIINLILASLINNMISCRTYCIRKFRQQLITVLADCNIPLSASVQGYRHHPQMRCTSFSDLESYVTAPKQSQRSILASQPNQNACQMTSQPASHTINCQSYNQFNNNKNNFLY